jgi:hypothetical protein
MRKNIIALSLLCAAIPLSVNAGLLDAVKGAAGAATGGSTTSSGGDASGTQDALVNAYVAANKQVLIAQSKMASALGASEAAALAKAEAESLSSGATKDNLAKADSVQSDVSKAISERQQAKGNKMDEASKKEYASGLATLGQGVSQYVGLSSRLPAFQSALTSASPMMIPKLSAGAYILKSFPNNSVNLKNTLVQAVSYAKSNDIPVPKDATAAL